MRGIPPRYRLGWGVVRISPAHAGNTTARRSQRPGPTDQPRTCGEYMRGLAVSSSSSGSAPHMRGIRSSPMDGTTSTWISPAHAGNTKNNGWKGVGYKDQPRTCGEYSPGRGQFSCGGGSAPHMRGILDERFADVMRRRISPAHAGNTFLCQPAGVFGGDQPRTCGEYEVKISWALETPGSAPHMRGIPPSPPRRRSLRRISPAHAGNTWQQRKCTPSGKDQPRTCGEYGDLDHRGLQGGGSAPHMRGIRERERERERWGGISPAHAGNTRPLSGSRCRPADQPRTCGEYGGGIAQMVLPLGSAPHMRGILGYRYPHRIVPGISPAHAGNTAGAAGNLSSPEDQPRTCGEYACRGRKPQLPGGSAPHMRGIPRGHPVPGA